MPTNHLFVKGKVQGVFYRATAKEAAQKIGLTGWVKNTEGGDVEAVVTGTPEQLNQFIAWCKKGPPAAVVSNVEVVDEEEQSFKEFVIVRG